MWHDDQRGDQRVVSGRAEASVAGAVDVAEVPVAGVVVDGGGGTRGGLHFGGVAVTCIRRSHRDSFCLTGFPVLSALLRRGYCEPDGRRVIAAQLATTYLSKL